MRPPARVHAEGSVAAVSGDLPVARIGSRGSRRFRSSDRDCQLATEAALHTTTAVCSSWGDQDQEAWLHHVLVLPERVQGDGSAQFNEFGLDACRWKQLPSNMLQGVKRAARRCVIHKHAHR